MATPVGNSVPLTGGWIDGLIWGGKWAFSGPPVLTYSLNYTDYSTIYWTAEGANAVARALYAWSTVANIQFSQISSGFYTNESWADMAFGLSGGALGYYLGAEALAVAPDPVSADNLLWSLGFNRTTYPRPEGDVYFDETASDFLYLYDGGRGFEIGLHEIGHALGLKHPFDAGPGGRPTFSELGIGHLDSRQYTVMSYTDYSPVQSYGHAATPMPLDILAIQHIYGANYSYRTGNDTYVLADDGILKTVWDAGGIDTFSAAGMASPVVIDLAEGGYSYHGIHYSTTAIAFGVVIENAVGGAAGDQIYGNSFNNILTGGAGTDLVWGGGGADTLADVPFGLNSDQFVDFSQADRIFVSGAYFGRTGATYNTSNGALLLDTDGDVATDTVVYLPGGLAGGFSINVVPGGTQIDFDAWSFKVWGGAASDVPVVGNFDGSGGDEYGVYRVATAEWFLYGQPPYVWGGGPYDMPVVGDYNRDGRDDFGVYRVNTAEWWIVGQPLYVWGGGAYDKPVVGDFNGDGVDDFGVYRVNTAEWWIVGQPKYVWGGGPNDVPVVGDYNGDGIDDFGVYRKDTAEWWIVGQPKYVWGGGANDTPVVGDFNGDGRDDFGVYRSDTGEWLIANQLTRFIGGGTNVPVPADYDGDGVTDHAVFNDGIWAIDPSSDVLV